MMSTMFVKLRTIISIIYLTSLVVACQSSQVPESSIAENIHGDQKPTPSIQFDESESEVLKACEASIQSAAMYPQQVPEWNATRMEACYELTLDLTYGDLTYEGEAMVTFTNLKGIPLSEVIFRTYPNAKRIYGGELNITSALVDGKEVVREEILSDRTAVRISFGKDLNPGETTVIKLGFQGKIPMDFGGNDWIYGVFNYASKYKVTTLANWYPILAVWEEGAWQAEPVIGIGDTVISEIALYNVRVKASPDLKVVATGSEVLRNPTDEWTLYKFVSGPARDFIVLASPNFNQTTIEKVGVRINHWGLLEGEDRWGEALDAAGNALELFNDRFGKYPYAELDVVSVPLKLASGVEYPGVILIKDELYQPDEERPFFLGLIVAHEVAHQWWYAVVGNDVIENPWQDEALATFSSLLYQEIHQPEYYDGTIQYYESRVEEAEKKISNTRINLPVRAFLDHPEDYSPIVYSKGGLAFLEIKRQIGEKSFYQALQSYYTDNRYQLPGPEILLGEFEQACQCKLDDLYDREGLR